MNKHAKGYRVEKLARDLLKKDGWLVEIKNWSQWQSKDFFNLFDAVCFKGCEVKLIQIKSNYNDWCSSKKKIKSWALENNIKIPLESWLYLGRGKWRIWVLDK